MPTTMVRTVAPEGGGAAEGGRNRGTTKPHKKAAAGDWRESSRWKTLSFCVLGAVLVICILNNLLAFRYKSAFVPLGCDLYAYLAASNLFFFFLHRLLSAGLHPPSVAVATSPVPLVAGSASPATCAARAGGVPVALPASWRGRLGRQLMLWFEFLTDKLGVSLLCIHLGFLLHLWLLSPDEGRLEMTLLDPALGRPLPEKDYGEGCNDLHQVALAQVCVAPCHCSLARWIGAGL